eukprot:4116638-Amphidinium_carterae.1
MRAREWDALPGDKARCLVLCLRYLLVLWSACLLAQAGWSCMFLKNSFVPSFGRCVQRVSCLVFSLVVLVCLVMQHASWWCFLQETWGWMSVVARGRGGLMADTHPWIVVAASAWILGGTFCRSCCFECVHMCSCLMGCGRGLAWLLLRALRGFAGGACRGLQSRVPGLCTCGFFAIPSALCRLRACLRLGHRCFCCLQSPCLLRCSLIWKRSWPYWSTSSFGDCVVRSMVCMVLATENHRGMGAHCRGCVLTLIRVLVLDGYHGSLSHVAARRCVQICCRMDAEGNALSTSAKTEQEAEGLDGVAVAQDEVPAADEQLPGSVDQDLPDFSPEEPPHDVEGALDSGLEANREQNNGSSAEHASSLHGELGPGNCAGFEDEGAQVEETLEVQVAEQEAPVEGPLLQQTVPAQAPCRFQQLIDELSGQLGLVVLERIALEHATLLDNLRASNSHTKESLGVCFNDVDVTQSVWVQLWNIAGGSKQGRGDGIYRLLRSVWGSAKGSWDDTMKVLEQVLEAQLQAQKTVHPVWAWIKSEITCSKNNNAPHKRAWDSVCRAVCLPDREAGVREYERFRQQSSSWNWVTSTWQSSSAAADAAWPTERSSSKKR